MIPPRAPAASSILYHHTRFATHQNIYDNYDLARVLAFIYIHIHPQSPLISTVTAVAVLVFQYLLTAYAPSLILHRFVAAIEPTSAASCSTRPCSSHSLPLMTSLVRTF
ncbi:Uncharacterized protein HZ326_17890 [Fusarium oxysporum f. sp. albedinis]|nr:hypothetical protein HZ326_21623 [Fusarium oxysporum f. sp. albedinis]KAJ0139159.1 Uncharacterized protein HZ326_17890 [Fusarium oxysporum f. sp. albedinis]